MKKILSAIFLLFISLYAAAQVSVTYSFGYGSYKMGDMKTFLEKTQLHIEEKHPGLNTYIVDDFPAYITHNLDIGYQIKRHEFGIKGGFYSTGGKISRQDYSGEYEFKTTINGYKTGIYYRNYLYNQKIGKKSSLSLFGEISPSVIISEVKIKSHLTINEEPLEAENTSIYKVDFACLPQVGVRYKIIPMIGVQLAAGYEIAFGEKAYRLDGNPRIDWSGFRASAGANISF